MAPLSAPRRPIPIAGSSDDIDAKKADITLKFEDKVPVRLIPKDGASLDFQGEPASVHAESVHDGDGERSTAEGQGSAHHHEEASSTPQARRAVADGFKHLEGSLRGLPFPLCRKVFRANAGSASKEFGNRRSFAPSAVVRKARSPCGTASVMALCALRLTRRMRRVSPQVT